MAPLPAAPFRATLVQPGRLRLSAQRTSSGVPQRSFQSFLQQAQRSGGGRLPLTLKVPANVRAVLAQSSGGVHQLSAVAPKPLPAPQGEVPAPQGGAAPKPASSGAAARLIQDGMAQIGKPYVFGANDFSANPAAFDCSSFTRWLFQRQGVDLPRTAQLQYNAVQHLAAAAARPGDLVFFRHTYDSPDTITHVGILLSGNRMLSATAGGVKIESLTDPYWAAHLAGFGRAPGLAAAAVSKNTPAPPPAQAAPSRPLSLDQYPRPADDNGRGLDWIPTTAQPPEVVDRFVREAADMHVRWVTFLNDGAQIGANDYLVKQLTAHGIMPVMRVLTHRGAPIQQDLTAMVQHYVGLGVRYFQLYNEPNLPSENQDHTPNVDRYTDLWLAAARQVVAGGGLPGLGALAPGAQVDDVAFLQKTLQAIKARGQADLLNHAWIGVHNYLLGAPGQDVASDPGFQRPQLYDQVVRRELGRSLPIIGTEGGVPPDHPVDASADRVLQAFRAVEQGGQPYNFSYTYWLIANEAGGGTDPTFHDQALFRPDGQSPLVDALKRDP